MAKKVAFCRVTKLQPLARIYAGCNSFARLPDYPLDRSRRGLSIELPKIGGKFIQMEDEIGAMAAVIGAL